MFFPASSFETLRHTGLLVQFSFPRITGVDIVPFLLRKTTISANCRISEKSKNITFLINSIYIKKKQSSESSHKEIMKLVH